MSVLDHTVRFEKYHGTGNDFVVVDATASVPNRGAFAAAHCDRETGVDRAEADAATLAESASDRAGADGALFLALEPTFSPPRIIMTLVQPDGSVASMCGNGARCAAAWAADRLDAEEFMIDTQAGTRRARVDGDEVAIEMGTPSFDPAAVPLAADRDEPLIAESVGDLTVTAVNTGVPHAVAFVDDVHQTPQASDTAHRKPKASEDVSDERVESEARQTESDGVSGEDGGSGSGRPGSDALDDIDLDAVAPAIRRADVFPEGANVTVAARDGDGFAQRTYERGVEGETRSCGTGAVAVVAAADRLGRVDGADSVRVSPPGGELRVTLPDRGPARLRGPAERSFGGDLPATPE